MVDQIEFVITFSTDIKLGDHKNRHQKWVDDLELAFTNSKDINLGDLKADTRQVVDQIEFASADVADLNLGDLNSRHPNNDGSDPLCIHRLCRYQPGRPQKQTPKMLEEVAFAFLGFKDINLGDLKS